MAIFQFLELVVLIIILTYTACSVSLFYISIEMISLFFLLHFRSPTIHVMASVLAWMSSCINPVIYAAMNRQYRQAYIRLFCGAKRRFGAPNSSSSATRSGSSHSKTLMSDVFTFNGNGNGNANGTNGIHKVNNEKGKKDEDNKV